MPHLPHISYGPSGVCKDIIAARLFLSQGSFDMFIALVSLCVRMMVISKCVKSHFQKHFLRKGSLSYGEGSLPRRLAGM